MMAIWFYIKKIITETGFLYGIQILMVEVHGGIHQLSIKISSNFNTMGSIVVEKANGTLIQ